MSDSVATNKRTGVYSRPPITEAVIEIRFLSPISKRDLESARTRFSSRFFGVVGIRNFQFQMPTSDARPRVDAFVTGYRFNSPDGTELLSISEQSISFSRLAPYSGWDEFCSAAFSLFNEFKKNFSTPPFGRIGLRYINRLDLPMTSRHEIVRLEKFITIQPQYPESDLPPLKHFTMQNVFDLTKLDCIAAVNVASVASPLPFCLSIILDIDLSKDHDVPQNLNSLKSLLDEFREEKNRIFETCITDTTRELFV